MCGIALLGGDATRAGTRGATDPAQFVTPLPEGMSKRGNVYVRRMLIHGARAVLLGEYPSAHQAFVCWSLAPSLRLNPMRPYSAPER
jgi:hypothetical protein